MDTLMWTLDEPAGQVQEGGTCGRHTQADPHPERGDPGPGPLAGGPCVNGD